MVNFYWWLQRCCVKHFRCLIALDSHNNPMGYFLTLSPSFSSRNWHLKRLHSFPNQISFFFQPNFKHICFNFRISQHKYFVVHQASRRDCLLIWVTASNFRELLNSSENYGLTLNSNCLETWCLTTQGQVIGCYYKPYINNFFNFPQDLEIGL